MPAITASKKAETAAFAANLVRVMAEKGMTQSDLARAIWGHQTDTRGRNVAKNRKYISSYVNGEQMPKPEMVRQLASALGVAPTELQRSLGLGTRMSAAPVNLTMIAGREDLAFLTVNKLLPTKAAMQIMAIIADAGDVELPAEARA